MGAGATSRVGRAKEPPVESNACETVASGNKPQPSEGEPPVEAAGAFLIKLDEESVYDNSVVT